MNLKYTDVKIILLIRIFVRGVRMKTEKNIKELALIKRALILIKSEDDPKSKLLHICLRESKIEKVM